MKNRSYRIRSILLFCLLIPSDVQAGLFTTLLSLFGGKAMFGLVVTAIAAYSAYRTIDTNKRFNTIDRAIEGVRSAVDDRPTKKEVAAHFANTDTKIAACAQTQKVDAQFHHVKTQLTKAHDQLTGIDTRVSNVQTQLTAAQLQLTEGFEATAKETAALREKVTAGLKELGTQVSGVEKLTKDELQKVQAALQDDTGKKLTALAQALDKRLANKKDIEAVNASVAAVQKCVQAVNSEMVTQQQLKVMHNDMQKFQAVTLLMLHGLCPIEASMQKLNDFFVQGNGATVFEVIQKNLVDKQQLKSELEKLGITAFAQSAIAGLEEQMKLMVQKQDHIVTKIDAGVAAVAASAAAAASTAARPAFAAYSPIPSSKPLTMGIGAAAKPAGAPQYHAVLTTAAGLPPAGAAQFLALLPPPTS